MEQIARFTERQLPQADRHPHAESNPPVGRYAQEQERPFERESRPTTIIRARSFSPMAVFRTVARLADYRDLLYTLSIHRLNVRYKQSILGPAWALLQPIALMLIYTVIFSRIARVPSEGAPYALFAFCALLPWLYFATALSTATNSLVTHVSLVTKVYFPREILPLTYVIAALADFLVASTVLGGLMVYYRVSPTPVAWYVLPIIAVLTVFATAASLVLCAVQVRYRDIGVALPLIMQLWMFATPVVYPLRVVPLSWRAAYELNPMVGIVESFRRVVVQGQPPAFHALMVSAIVSAVLLPIAFAYFKHVEATVADVI